VGLATHLKHISKVNILIILNLCELNLLKSCSHTSVEAAATSEATVRMCAHSQQSSRCKLHQDWCTATLDCTHASSLSVPELFLLSKSFKWVLRSSLSSSQLPISTEDCGECAWAATDLSTTVCRMSKLAAWAASSLVLYAPLPSYSVLCCYLIGLCHWHRCTEMRNAGFTCPSFSFST
jgi:hypothetical protein